MAPLLLRSRKTTKAKGGTTSQLRETFFPLQQSVSRSLAWKKFPNKSVIKHAPFDPGGEGHRRLQHQIYPVVLSRPYIELKSSHRIRYARVATFFFITLLYSSSSSPTQPFFGSFFLDHHHPLDTISTVDILHMGYFYDPRFSFLFAHGTEMNNST